MERPNILFMHVDQMHGGAVSAYGCGLVHTPRMDQMAAEGHSFRRMYTAMPQCCPARASWYTGRMSKEHGVTVNGYPIDPELPDLGQWLRRHGDYDCVYTGKWHVSGRKVGQSFDVLHHGHGHGELQDSDIARSAVAYLANRKDDQPFFLNVGFLNPHDCCFPAFREGGPCKYGIADDMLDQLPPLPENFDYGYPEHGHPATRHWTLQDWRYYIYNYYRMVEMVDREIGRVYDAVRNSDLAKNTLIIFTADHGDGAGFHAHISKGYLEEEAWHVPAIVHAPGMAKPGTHDKTHLASGVDVAATICDYAGAPPLPKTTLARSWRPVLEGQDVPWREYVVGETSIGPLSTAIREERYKTIFYEDRAKLYDLRDDPLEQRNLAEDPAHAATLARHRGHLRDYVKSIEVYPGPEKGLKKVPNQGVLYGNYVKWYDQIKAEA